MNNQIAYLGSLNVGASTGEQITVGWLPAPDNTDLDFQTYSKNLAEYMACEMHFAGFQNQIYSDSVSDLLERTELLGSKFCLINQIGYWSSQFNHEITRYLTQHYTGQSVVGDLDLRGITLVNISWWVQAGRPAPGTAEFKLLATRAGYSDWPTDLIIVADMCPTAPDYDNTMASLHATTFNTDVFFCANTEDRNLTPDTSPAQVTDHIITVAGGLSAVLMAYTYSMPANSTIQVIDTSPLAIEMSQQIFNHWDGVDYKKFVEQLMAQNPDQVLNFRGIRQLDLIDSVVSQLPGFRTWFLEVFPTYNISYSFVDLMNYSDVEQLMSCIDLTQDRQVVVNFSNVYHYVPSSFYMNYDTRRSLSVKVMRLLGDMTVSNKTKIKLLGGHLPNHKKMLDMFPWRKK
jgi:hypothetical protein